MKKLILLAVIIFGAIFAYYYFVGNIFDKNYKIPLFNKGQGMTLTSPAFSNGSQIPTQYTCDGADINPPLKFANVPIEAKSLALIVEDPDSQGEFTHWVIFNIQPQSNGINENEVVPGEIEGINDFGTNGYAGPCPTIGEHHYVFKVFALNDFINLQSGATKKELLSEIQNITLQTATLTGLYKKQ